MRRFMVILMVVGLVAAACGEDEPTTTTPTSPTGTETSPAATGLLATILEAGVIRVSTDPAYPPQSSLNEDTGQWEGFDIDVATEIATRLGVEIEWKTPAWDTITAGNWNGRWDMSVGSMAPTVERAEVLNFAPAYYFTPAGIAVHQDNTTIADLTTDLDGKTIGSCLECTYQFYMEKRLHIVLPGYEFDYVIDDPNITTYDTDTTGIDDLALGDGVRLDAMFSSIPTLETAIKDGKPIKIVGEPLFYEPLAVAIDKSAPEDPTSLVDEISQIIEDMHADGTLTDLSMKWYGVDFSVSQ